MMKNAYPSQSLQLAREYEQEKIKSVPPEQRPAIHVTPPVGWMNDPNGFSLYQGEYHLFYQYHPYGTNWGPMHWGHVKTKDFINWERLPCALAPDMEYDGQGCFSGSALEADGKHILMYTSVQEQEQADGRKRIRQTQSIAVGDGRHYEKFPQNPVIKGEMLPQGSSRADFRDPKIWRDEQGFYAVVGSKLEDGRGQLLLYSSADAYEWKYETVLDHGEKKYGEMWECPDFFPLADKQILIVSPQFMQAQGLAFHNGNNSLYFIGQYDRDKHIWERQDGVSLDFGLDFYAPQTLQTADGRRIMIGWLQNWDNYMTPDNFEWSGMMTIPRELSLEGECLRQRPVRELAGYQANEIRYEKQILEKAKTSLPGVNGRCIDLELTVTDGDYSYFEIAVAADEEHATKLIYDRLKGTVTTDRSASGLKRDVLCSRSMYVTKDKAIKMRILIDLYSVEVFVNDGEQVMSSLIYTPLEAEGIYLDSDGRLEYTIIKYDIVKA